MTKGGNRMQHGRGVELLFSSIDHHLCNRQQQTIQHHRVLISVSLLCDPLHLSFYRLPILFQGFQYSTPLHSLCLAVSTNFGSLVPGRFYPPSVLCSSDMFTTGILALRAPSARIYLRACSYMHTTPSVRSYTTLPARSKLVVPRWPNKFPSGMSDFRKVRKSRMVYFDKTSFIPEIHNFPSDTILFCRPRRFGKSLTVSMLECFHGVQYRDRYEQLFKVGVTRRL
jgi:hypothetical protein